MNFNFWERGDFREAHLGKVNLPSEEVLKIHAWVENKERFLVFLGNPGVGKSYLIASLIHDLNEKKENKKNLRKIEQDKIWQKIHKKEEGWEELFNNPTNDKIKLLEYQERHNFTFKYLHERELFGFCRECMQKDFDYQKEVERICETRYFFLDDIGSTQLTEFQKEVLQHVIDTRWISGLPTMITSNIFLKQMYEVFEPRFISRLKDKRNTIIELNWEDKRQI